MEQQQSKSIWRTLSFAVALSLFVAVCVVAIWDSYANTPTLTAALSFLLAAFLFWVSGCPRDRHTTAIRSPGL
jgi:hypothetical protein